MNDDPTDRILGAIEALSGRTERLEAGQMALRTALLAKMERLQDAITGLRDDVVINMGATDRVERRSRERAADVESLGAEVSVLRRQIQRLQTQVREIRGEP